MCGAHKTCMCSLLSKNPTMYPQKFRTRSSAVPQTAVPKVPLFPMSQSFLCFTFPAHTCGSQKHTV